MQVKDIQSLFLKYKEATLFHRYIVNKNIEPLLGNLKDFAEIEILGKSVLNKSIYGLKIGNGNKRVLMWSQMHGNESTTTKAIFDLLNSLISDHSLKHILSTCTLYIVPILNPDGAEAYTRVNANGVDLNRDAQNLTQPESRVLRMVFNDFKPHFCFNLHGQRTIFSAGNINKPATVSFLAPAQDNTCSITPNRKVAMEIISVMNNALQVLIPGQVGVYDDAFNLNCVGDTFQSENVPTILFEAGHYNNDYGREETRAFIFVAYIASLNYISSVDIKGTHYKSYFNIPENEKRFYDVIIRNAKIKLNANEAITDIGILFQEKLVRGKVDFVPVVDKIENLDFYFSHNEIDANGHMVMDEKEHGVAIGDENVFVIINNEKISLFSK